MVIKTFKYCKSWQFRKDDLTIRRWKERGGNANAMVNFKNGKLIDTLYMIHQDAEYNMPMCGYKANHQNKILVLKWESN